MSFQAYIDNIKTITGKTPDDFKKIAKKKGLLKPGVKAMQIINWLKEDFGLGHGHAMAIYAVLTSVKQPKQTAESAVSKYFSGSKSHWRKLFDDLMKKVEKFGNDIQISPTNTYLSILRNGKKFAIAQATTDRIDIGIKLKGAPFSEKFEASRKWNAMVTHRVRITNPKQVDKELIKWLQNAYEKA
jgi:hypothetical protein